MRFLQFCKCALRELSKDTMRSGLTMLGIIIGVSSFIVIVGIIKSATVVIKNRIYTYGTNAISVYSEGKQFSETDCIRLKQHIHDIKFITPLFFHPSLNVKYGKNHISSRIYGANNDYFLIKDWTFLKGRRFSDAEIYSFQKVAVIGNSQKTELFEGIDPIGKNIHLNGIPFRVIGILDETGKALSGRDMDNVVVVPYTTMGQKVINSGYFREILASVSASEVLDPTILIIRRYISRIHNIPMEGLTYLKISTSREMLKTADIIIRVLGFLLIIATIISLVVGGINIMNVMLASVTERTREIGIRLAVGAKKSDIMSQFIIESSILSATGGIIGIIIGILVNLTIVYLLGWPFLFSFTYVIISFVFSCTIGILFGIYPARMASMKLPIEALNSY